MRKPNFFVVGAAKSGTTSLYHYLKQHPDIFLPIVKEPVYFAYDIVEMAFRCNKHIREFNYKAFFSQKVIPERHILYLKDFKFYKKLYEDVKGKTIVGDTSALYLFSKVAAKEIKKFNPDAKIVILLRNPVERAYSQFLMRLRDGKIKEENFIKEVMFDFKKSEAQCKDYYLEQGLYAEQIQRFFEVFDRNSIRIFLFEEFIGETERVLREIFTFLGVSFFSVDYSKVMNESVLPRYPLLNSVVKTIRRNFGNFYTRKTPIVIKNFYNKLFMSKEKPSLSPEEKESLIDFFRDDILKTEKLIGKDLSHWLG